MDAEHHDYLEHIRGLKGILIVCAMPEDALNVYYAITLRSGGFEGEIIALSDSAEENRKLTLAGVSRIFDMYQESAERFVELIEEESRV